MKTILLSISNPAIYRNFGLFPNAVLEQLSREANVFLVVVVKKGLTFGIKPIPGRLVIEEVEEEMRRTLLQQAFTFFYSYLIFTNTTKLVSSYGVRSDKPRPLFRYYNYPLKLFIASTFGKWTWMRERVVPALYRRIFASYRPYQALFQKYRFDLVFLPNVCIWPADLELIVESRRHNIPVLGMPGNWDHLSKYFIPFKPDHLLVWSEAVKEEAVRYQFYDTYRVESVGAPQIDFFSDRSQLRGRAEFLQSIGFPETAKVVTYASQGPYSVDGPDYVDMLLAWIDEGSLDSNLHVIIRPHPHGLLEKEKYERFKSHPRVYLDTVEGWSSLENVRNFMNVMAHSDVVVTTFSSVATEAPIWDRPTIIVSFDGYKQRPLHQSVRRHRNFTHFTHVVETGGVGVTESPEQFKNALATYLKHPEKDALGRERLRTEVFGSFDGGSAERIVAQILKHVGITNQKFEARSGEVD